MTGTEFQTSKLGTKAYWDSIYEQDTVNFNEIGEIGEIWFGEESVAKMVDWVDLNIDKEALILDLGCGNGHLLLELHDLGYTKLTGVDYSLPSIVLCKDIAKKAGKSEIKYQVLDVINECNQNQQFYDLILDKGTFDAISLASFQDYKVSEVPSVIYVKNVATMIKQSGFLLITSCNWTESELLDKFSQYFEFHQRLPYPTFKFGGSSGSTITSLILKLK